MSNQVRAHGLGNARTLSRFSASFPEHLRSDRFIGTPTVLCSGKQIGLGMHPAPILAQSLEQFRTEWHIPIAVSLPVPDMDQHADAIDVLDLEMAHLGSPHSR